MLASTAVAQKLTTESAVVSKHLGDIEKFENGWGCFIWSDVITNSATQCALLPCTKNLEICMVISGGHVERRIFPCLWILFNETWKQSLLFLLSNQSLI